MIADSVRFLVGQGKEVVYDGEHFFDGYRSDRDYALHCVEAAIAGGAANVTLCDTNGALLPASRRGDGRRRRVRRRARRDRHPHARRRRVRRRELASRPSRPAHGSSRARPTATASAAATPT